MRSMFFLIAAGLLAACDGAGTVAVSPVGNRDGGLLEIIHASPDAPDVDVLVEEQLAASSLPFKSGAVFFAPGEVTELEIAGRVPGEGEDASPFDVGTVTVIGPELIETPFGSRITVFVANLIDAIEPIVVTGSLGDVADGQVRIRVVHAAAIFDPEMVAVFLTAPGAGLDSPTGTLAFGDEFGPFEVAMGEYRIRITAAGDPETLLFDSGTLNLPGGADLVIAAVASALPDRPLSLLVADSSGVTEIIDEGVPATVRVGHFSADAPPIDARIEVLADGDAASLMVRNLAFPEVTARERLAAGDYDVNISPAGAGPEAALIDGGLGLVAGTSYTVVAVGPRADIDVRVLVDETRRIGTEARLRIFHGAPSAEEVDVYVGLRGTDFAEASPLLEALPFGSETGFLAVAPGSYDLIVTAAGGDPLTPVIGPIAVELTASGIFTAVAIDASGGGPPFDLISLDDPLVGD